uniref:Cytochrome P450 monooxygenase claO n=1 Tax=Ampulloclitocybe clavipes TaxID=56467 RepID=CLAO_AMPCV
MTPAREIGAFNILVFLIFLWLLSKLVGRLGRRGRTTPLRGPANKSLLFGLTRYINVEADDSGAVYESWAAEYGPAFRVPGVLGSHRIVICDAKAIAHFYSKETFGYVQSPRARSTIKNIVGRGLLWSEGESHRRQRKALSPAFSNAAIRRLTSVFFDSSYKMKAAWDSILETNPDNTVIDVQKWMNHISLDSIGIAGFSHDFGSLDGKHSDVAAVFDSFGSINPSYFSMVIFLLALVFPILLKLPTNRNLLVLKLRERTSEIADVLLERTRKEKEGRTGTVEEKSIIGLLIKAESAETELHMSQEEIVAQMNVLLLAGYETTSSKTFLTWALIELSKNPEKQAKLREELLSQYTTTDPTWEQLANGLPYLDSVVHEILRLHPPVGETFRVAAEDDIIPLSRPLVTLSGQTVSSIAIGKGTMVGVPIRCMNRSEVLWGKDAKEFRPERWLEPGFGENNEVQGHRHLLTFIDGPRTCLGRGFALAEFKAVLSVLIRKYAFEFPGPGGAVPKIEKHRSILPRPKVEGQDGAKVPLRVRRVE